MSPERLSLRVFPDAALGFGVKYCNLHAERRTG
jgi:hypothetical protein